jgi:hypothetical protein
MSTIRCVAATAALAFASMTASAGIISFSFSPPVGGGSLLNIRAAGSTPDSGLMVSDQSVPLTFTVDATAEGLGVTTFSNARMFMTISLPRATQTGVETFTSNISGTFTIYDYTGDTRVDILTATLSGGTFLKARGSHVMGSESATGLTFTPGPRLSAILGVERELVAPQLATFALSNVTTFGGSPEILRPDLTFESFTATPSFSGSSEVLVIPAPGAVALAGLGGMLAIRRRRR